MEASLTVGRKVFGGILEGLEGLILLQALGKVLCRLCIEVAGLQAASMSQMEASAGLNSREWATK